MAKQHGRGGSTGLCASESPIYRRLSLPRKERRECTIRGTKNYSRATVRVSREMPTLNHAWFFASAVVFGQLPRIRLPVGLRVSRCSYAIHRASPEGEVNAKEEDVPGRRHRSFLIVSRNKLWYLDSIRSEKYGIPREFTTSSRVIVISNDSKTLNMNVAALQDRGHVIVFKPSAAEVHRKAGTWFDNREIYEWFSTNLHRVREQSMRQYVRARELKAAAMDWTDVLAVEAENKRQRLCRRAAGQRRLRQHREARRGVREPGRGCRATFFNYRRKVVDGNGAG
jgi:hypothetical protein